MKYSNNFEKINYNTTIGNFNIVDMTSYLKPIQFDESDYFDYDVDNSSTLVETSNNLYGDPDSSWMILIANKEINPFKLLKPNSFLQIDKFKNYEAINLTLGSPNVDFYLTIGSIVANRVQPSGVSWSYGYTGYFSLTGGFAIVDSINPFSKRITLKPPIGFVEYLENNEVSTITKGKTAYEVKEGNTFAPEILGQPKKKPEIENKINYTDAKEIKYIELESELPAVQKGTGINYTPNGTPEPETFEESFKNENISIKAFYSNKFRMSKFEKIVQKYNNA